MGYTEYDNEFKDVGFRVYVDDDATLYAEWLRPDGVKVSTDNYDALEDVRCEMNTMVREYYGVKE